jgi:1,4-dihydroxy-2-naphthoyl-CoA hydrolase
MNDAIQLINSRRSQFTELLGTTVTEVMPNSAKATLGVREELCIHLAILHGGAVMSFADNMGALACVLNIPEGARTMTLESKTNFLASIPMGETAFA